MLIEKKVASDFGLEFVVIREKIGNDDAKLTVSRAKELTIKMMTNA